MQGLHGISFASLFEPPFALPFTAGGGGAALHGTAGRQTHAMTAPKCIAGTCSQDNREERRGCLQAINKDAHGGRCCNAGTLDGRVVLADLLTLWPFGLPFQSTVQTPDDSEKLRGPGHSSWSCGDVWAGTSAD